MDLMEYQAKELFAKHGVTTTLGVVVETAHGTFHNPLSERFFTTRSSGSRSSLASG